MPTTHKKQYNLEAVFFILLLFALGTLSFGIRALTNLSLMSVALVGLITLRKADWRKSLKDPITLSFWAFFLIYFISLVYTCNTEAGWRNLETKMSFLIAAPILRAYQTKLEQSQLIKLLKAYVLGVLAALIFLLINAAVRSLVAGSFSHLSEGGTYQRYFFLYESLSEAIMHPGYFSLYVGIAVLGTLYLGLESYWNKKLLIPILSVFSLGLLLLQGRMTIIALAFSLGLWLIISLVKSKSWKPILIAATIAIGIFTVFYNLAPKSLSERYLAFPDFSYDISGSDFNSATYRLAEWKCAWDGIKDEPLKGYGIGCGQVELFKRYEKFKFWEGLDRQYNAHNQYLETTLNIGFIGLSALLLMLLSIAAMAIKYNNYLMLYALIFFACCLLTESMLERAWAVVLFNLFFPIFINLRKQ